MPELIEKGGVLTQGKFDKKPFLIIERGGKLWVCSKHPDGQWVTGREADEDDKKLFDGAPKIQTLEDIPAHLRSNFR